MRTFKTYLNWIIVLVSTCSIILSACKKNENYDDGIPAVSFDSSIPDTVFYGEKLKINFIAKNLSSGILTIAPVGNQDSIVSQESIENPNKSYIFSSEVVIPEDGSWSGNFLISLDFNNTKGSREVVFAKSPIKDYYILGGSSSVGWEPPLAIKFNRFTKEEDGKTVAWYDYFGYMTTTGDGLKIIPTQLGWDGELGMTPNQPGKITSEGGVNIQVPKDGFYRMRLDMNDPSDRTYELVPSNWGIMGDATTGQWKSDLDMTFTNPEKGKYEWSITINLTGGKHIKFRENDSWNVGLGVSEGTNLSYTGSNIPISADGLYLVKLILEPSGYKYSIEKK